MVTELEIAKLIAKKYSPLPDKELNELAGLLKKQEAKKGEILLGMGEIARDLIFIYTGLLRQFYYKNGRDITEHFTCEGYMTFCILSLFRQLPTQLMIEALEQSTVYHISYEKLTLLSYTYPRIAELKSKILEASLIISQEKADSWRFETTKERYERFLNEYPEAVKRASVNHIASYLLMTPESLSRIRKLR